MKKKDNRPAADPDASLDPPAAVRSIARKLEHAGFETWCVGGAVRDALLGRAHLDWDLATAATPPQVRRLFRHTIPLGVQFGTVGVLDARGVMHEVTTFRRDVQTDGRHAVVEFGASLDEDLARRDFTINAMAYSPSTGRLHDPFGGRDDLRKRVIRAVGEPAERMREDRLRALRAIRFAARFDFAIEPRTWTAIVESAPHLGRLSAERVKQEIEKTMEQVARPSRAFGMWRDAGALDTLIPELAAAQAVDFCTTDHLPRPGLAGRPQRLITRIAGLFLGLGREASQRALRRLRFSNQQATWCSELAGSWTALGGTIGDALVARRSDPVAARRWVAAIGRVKVPSFMRLAFARWCAMHEAGLPAPEPASVRALHRRMLRAAFRDPVELSDLAVDGDDLRGAGIPPGRHLGRILAALLDWVLEDPRRNARDLLVRRALELHRRRSDRTGNDEG